MTAITFDTLDAARTLRNAGVDKKTAEAIVAVVQKTADLPDVTDLATKSDLNGVQIELNGTNKRLDVLQSLAFASMGFNLAGFLGIAAFLYTVLKH